MTQSASPEGSTFGTKKYVGNERRVGLTHPNTIKNKSVFQPRVKNIRSKDISSQEERNLWDEDDPHGMESFPQYCMTCDKQFPLTSSCRYLYCSETCKQEDQRFEYILPTITANNSSRYSSFSSCQSQQDSLHNLLRKSSTLPISAETGFNFLSQPEYMDNLYLR